MEKLDVRTKVAVVGLGYVGLPLAVAFAEHFPTVGYDCSREKIECYRQGRDVTEEVGDRALAGSALTCTTDPSVLKEIDFIIVAVPTPVNLERLPDLGLVREASRTIGRNLSRGTIVCYESTVYPGVTETVCGPILEQESGLKAGLDFHLAIPRSGSIPGTGSTGSRTSARSFPGMTRQPGTGWRLFTAPSSRRICFRFPASGWRKRPSSSKTPSGM